MNRAIQNDRLQRVIADQAQTAQSTKQISQRLKSLLPLRFRELRRDAEQTGLRGSKAERAALTDERYRQYLDEYLEIKAAGFEARIQYETHRMLMNARRSLRAFRR